MPAFSRKQGGPLTDEQVEALAEGIKPRWKAGRPEAPPPDYLVAAGGAKGDAERGRQVFARACAACHGDGRARGRGQGRADQRPGVPGPDQRPGPPPLRITGRPDLRCPTSPGRRAGPTDFQPLTPAEVDDLVALARRAGDEAGADATDHDVEEHGLMETSDGPDGHRLRSHSRAGGISSAG